MIYEARNNQYVTFDMYINNQLSGTGIADFYRKLPYGTEYEIKNIRTSTGYKYEGTYRGRIKGTTPVNGTEIVLKISPEKYSVIFDGNGGSTPEAIQGEYKKSITLPSSTRNGYEFKGWSKEQNATTKQYSGGEQYTIISEYNVLYAVWEAKNERVTFDGNGGRAGKSYIDAKHDEKISLPSAEREGYTFLGWAESSNATEKQYSEGIGYTMNGSKTLYAVWEAKKYYLDVNLCVNNRMVYDKNDYVVFDVYINNRLYKLDVSDFYQELPYGTKYEIRNISARSGYKYKGIISGEKTGTVKTGKTEVVIEITSQEFKLVYADDGGNISEKEKTVYYGKTYQLPTGTKTEYDMNYEVSGWQDDNGVYSGTWKCEGEYGDTITLYPIWKVVSVNIYKTYKRDWKTGESVSEGWGQVGTEIDLPKNIRVKGIYEGSAIVGFKQNVKERSYGLKIEAYNRKQMG